MPRRPARPVSWVYSPGVTSACVSPLNLTSRSRTTVRAGMLMPSARVSVANTTRTRPVRMNSSSTVSLNAGIIPAWCAATPRSQPVEPFVEAEHRRGPPGPARRCAARRAPGSARPLGLVGGQPHAGQPRTASDRRVAAGAAEDEGDGRQQAARGVQPFATTSGTARVRLAPTRRWSCREAAAHPALDLGPVAGGRRRTIAAAARGQRLAGSRSSPNRSNIRVPTITCCHSGTGRISWTTTVGVAAHGDQPLAELLGVGHRRRQRHQPHGGRGRWMITSSHTAPRNRSPR